jgi:hypothetical protein
MLYTSYSLFYPYMLQWYRRVVTPCYAMLLCAFPTKRHVPPIPKQVPGNQFHRQTAFGCYIIQSSDQASASLILHIL